LKGKRMGWGKGEGKLRNHTTFQGIKRMKSLWGGRRRETNNLKEKKKIPKRATNLEGIV